jgi:hypothetical protein
MNTNIKAHITCPICGEPSQELKENVSGKLYMYCDRGCSIKFNSRTSREYLARLNSGVTISDKKIGIIMPVNYKKPTTKTENNHVVGENANDNRGNTINRRTDGQDTGAATTNGNAGARILQWLTSGDDEE